MSDTNEHVGSYYAATRHQVEFPQLPGGRWFANPVLALGMMYYRVKELL